MEDEKKTLKETLDRMGYRLQSKTQIELKFPYCNGRGFITTRSYLETTPFGRLLDCKVLGYSIKGKPRIFIITSTL